MSLLGSLTPLIDTFLIQLTVYHNLILSQMILQKMLERKKLIRLLILVKKYQKIYSKKDFYKFIKNFQKIHCGLLKKLLLKFYQKLLNYAIVKLYLQK